MLANTEFDKYMPKYYIYTERSEQIPLIDLPDSSTKDVVSVLKIVKELACKPCNGSGSEGFYKLSYNEGKYSINEKDATEEVVKQFVEEHPNYVFTEYLHPETSMANIFPLIHTIRLQVINRRNEIPVFVGGYLRFGTQGTGASNLMNASTEAQFDYDVAINYSTGEYGKGKAVYLNKVVDMPMHPDTNVLAEGKIECWNEVLDMVYGICKRFNMIEYMAFDICISTKGIKIMEINSHGGIKHLQLRKPFLADSVTREYYEKKIENINKMTEDEKEIHKNIPR